MLYGGRSGEHEVSLASAAAVFAHLDKKRYEGVPIRIEKDGRWCLADKPPTAMSAAEVIEQARLDAARPLRHGREVHMIARPSEETVLSIDRSAARLDDDLGRATVTGLNLDVIFPVLHGPYGEDGTIQGLLELANVPYVGAGVLASAVGMDKAIMKLVFSAHGLPVCPYRVVLRHDWERDGESTLDALESALGYPMFVKPANLGSSVGISKAKEHEGLSRALDLAGSFDRKIVVEAAVPEAREIECAVLGNDAPEASVAGEVDSVARVLRLRGEVPRRSVAGDHSGGACAGAGRARSARCRSRPSAPSTAPAWPGWTSCSPAPPAPSSSTKSTPSPASRPSACIRSCGPRPASTTRTLLDRLISLALERHAAKQQLRTSLT